MTGLYNRTPLTRNTPATAEQVNGEFFKVQSAIDQLQAMIQALQVGDAAPSYIWRAFADSVDGTANFTTGEPEDRAFIGFAYNKGVETPSANPEDYEWSRYRGIDGTNGSSTEYRFIRQNAKPAQPVGSNPAGWTVTVPAGDARVWMTFATRAAGGDLLSAWAAPYSLQTYNPRGAYDTAVEYYQGDTVTFGGGTYAASTTTTGHAPSGTAQDNGFWSVVAAPGDPGEPSTPPAAFTATIDLTSSATGVNLRTIADGAGYTGMSDATITFRVPNGVTIQGVGSSGKAIDTGSWPTGYTLALSLVVQSGGTVRGGGGEGGAGGSGTAGAAGGAGGDAIYCRVALSVTVNSGGTVQAGGGGGAGGLGKFISAKLGSRGGGGGGGGFPNGYAGSGGEGDGGWVDEEIVYPGADGSPGTTSGGGAGGAGNGTATNGGGGGGVAAAGTAVASSASGGAAGYAVRKNGFTVPVTNNGTLTGTAA